MIKVIVAILDDVLLLVGCGLIIFGVGMISTPAMLIVTGIILICLAVLIGKAKVRNDIE